MGGGTASEAHVCQPFRGTAEADATLPGFALKWYPAYQLCDSLPLFPHLRNASLDFCNSELHAYCGLCAMLDPRQGLNMLPPFSSALL